jgi:peptidoglycan/xylan/chitin deacetylase (PgdA/CDA1 family)
MSEPATSSTVLARHDDVMLGLRLLPGARRRPIVFVFHDVSDREWFQDCVREISSTHEILPLEEVVSRRRPRTCALTFDDGLLSVSEVAHPVLSEHKLPYTIFICTDVLAGGPVPWFIRLQQLANVLGVETLRTEWHFREDCVRNERELAAALKEIPLDRILSGLARLEKAYEIAPPAPERLFMSPQRIQDLAAEKVSFGSHTRRHPILSKLSVQDQLREITVSRDEVERLVGIRPSHFAYPNGSRLDFDQTTVSILRSNGFTYAYTTIQRHLSRDDEPFALPRIGLEVGDSRLKRAMKQLTPWLSRSHTIERKIRVCVNPDRDC